MRVLTVLEMLQAREYVSSSEIASRLEVSRRTVQRYILRLRDLGIPVDARHGIDGAYCLKRGRRMPPLVVSNKEALALALGLVALRRFGFADFVAVVSAASSKLERLLPEGIRARVQDLQQTIETGASQGVVPAELQTVINISVAARTRQRVRCYYETRDGRQVERDVDPYSVLHYNDRWYVIGHCHLRVELRSFRLDRIRRLEVLTARFWRPAQFNAKEFLQQSLSAISERQRCSALERT